MLDNLVSKMTALIPEDIERRHGICMMDIGACEVVTVISCLFTTFTFSSASRDQALYLLSTAYSILRTVVATCV